MFHTLFAFFQFFLRYKKNRIEKENAWLNISGMPITRLCKNWLKLPSNEINSVRNQGEPRMVNPITSTESCSANVVRVYKIPSIDPVKKQCKC